MFNLTINGLDVSVEKGTSLLEAAQFLGFPIPTLCHLKGSSPYGACPLCMVEIGEGRKIESRKFVHLSALLRNVRDLCGRLDRHVRTRAVRAQPRAIDLAVLPRRVGCAHRTEKMRRGRLSRPDKVRHPGGRMHRLPDLHEALPRGCHLRRKEAAPRHRRRQVRVMRRLQGRLSRGRCQG
jgi:hypothetical protein